MNFKAEKNLSHFKDNPHTLITMLPADLISFWSFSLVRITAAAAAEVLVDFLARRCFFRLYHAHDNLHLIKTDTQAAMLFFRMEFEN